MKPFAMLMGTALALACAGTTLASQVKVDLSFNRALGGFDSVTLSTVQGTPAGRIEMDSVTKANARLAPFVNGQNFASGTRYDAAADNVPGALILRLQIGTETFPNLDRSGTYVADQQKKKNAGQMRQQNHAPPDAALQRSDSSFFTTDDGQTFSQFELRNDATTALTLTVLRLYSGLDDRFLAPDIFFSPSAIGSGNLRLEQLADPGVVIVPGNGGSLALSMASGGVAHSYDLLAFTAQSLGSDGSLGPAFSFNMASVPVPEPGSALLGALGGVALLASARGRQVPERRPMLRHRTRPCLARLAFGLAAGLTLAQATQAGEVSGDAAFGPRLAAAGNFGPNATSALFAYSERNTIDGKAEPSGPNAMTSAGDVDAGSLFIGQLTSRPAGEYFGRDPRIPGYRAAYAVNEAASGNPAKPKVAICTPRAGCDYAPAVTAGNNPKLATKATVIVSGSPGVGDFQASGIAAYYAPGVHPRDFRDLAGVMAAGGTVARRAGGKAAGAAFDPIPLNPGSPPYQSRINATLALEGPDDHGGLLYLAVDNRSSADLDTFMQREAPLDESLWYLSIGMTGRITGSGDLLDPARLDIQFRVVRPDLLRLADGTGGAVADDAVANAVRQAFSFADGFARLSDFALFPVATGDTACGGAGQALCGSTLYQVTSGVVYGQLVSAGLVQAAAAVPEPAAALLLALGSLVLLVPAFTARCGRSRTARP